MGIRSYLRGLWMAATDSGWKSERDIAADPSAWSGGGWSGASLAGPRITPERAMCWSPWFAGIRAISEDVGKLPLITYRRLQPRGKERAPQNPRYRLLKNRPNPYMGSMTFRETLTSWALGWGRGCAQIVRDGGGVPRQLWPIHPSRIIPKREAGELWYDISTDDLGTLPQAERGRPIRLAAENVLHIHGLGDGFDGYSLVQLALQTIGTGLAGELQAASYFGNGVRLSGVLQHPGKLGDKALKNIRESMIQPHQGAQNQWDVMIAEEGMTFKDAPRISPKDAQALEGRQFGVEEVARWLRMPPHKLQHLLRSTNNNIEHQAQEYDTDTLLPWLVRWDEETEAKIFLGDPEHFAEHLMIAILRADSAARSAFYHSAIIDGWMSQDDVRELENMNPLPGGIGSRYWMQVNMAPIDVLADGSALKPGAVQALVEPIAMHSLLSGKNGTHAGAEDSRRIVVELAASAADVIRPAVPRTVETEITEWNAQGRPVKSIQRVTDG